MVKFAVIVFAAVAASAIAKPSGQRRQQQPPYAQFLTYEQQYSPERPPPIGSENGDGNTGFVGSDVQRGKDGYSGLFSDRSSQSVTQNGYIRTHKYPAPTLGQNHETSSETVPYHSRTNLNSRHKGARHYETGYKNQKNENRRKDFGYDARTETDGVVIPNVWNRNTEVRTIDGALVYTGRNRDFRHDPTRNYDVIVPNKRNQVNRYKDRDADFGYDGRTGIDRFDEYYRWDDNSDYGKIDDVLPSNEENKGSRYDPPIIVTASREPNEYNGYNGAGGFINGRNKGRSGGRRKSTTFRSKTRSFGKGSSATALSKGSLSGDVALFVESTGSAYATASAEASPDGYNIDDSSVETIGEDHPDSTAGFDIDGRGKVSTEATENGYAHESVDDISKWSYELPSLLETGYNSRIRSAGMRHSTKY